MSKSDPHFSHPFSASREEVFERLHKALSDLAAYPHQKVKVLIGRLSFSNASNFEILPSPMGGWITPSSSRL
jgi:hypothetical protein